MSLVVYVWNPVDRIASNVLHGDWGQIEICLRNTSSSGGLGHASLQAGDIYISLWPPIKKECIPFSASKNYNHDVQKRILREAEHVIRLDNLPDLEVRKFWSKFRTPFNEVGNNCCHVVAKALHIAKNEYLQAQRNKSVSQITKQAISSLGMYYLSATGNIVWSPGLITNFALALKLFSSKD